MAKHRCHSIVFKRVPRSSSPARRSTVSQAPRHLTQPDPRLGAKYEAGAFDEDARAADLLQECEAKIAALERLVGRQALEMEFLKRASRNAPRLEKEKKIARVN